MITHIQADPSYALPLQGAANPGTTPTVTTPGSFALESDVGGPLMFASPDTPGMPKASDKTAWDFLPDGWLVVKLPANHEPTPGCDACLGDDKVFVEFRDARGQWRRVIYPKSFKPITQLESARLGIITPQMKRVAEREPHLTAEQV